MFRSRSKSGGQSPSRSEGKPEPMGEKVKSQEDEIMVENESDLMDRLEILGDLTDNLDKKQIDGRELDKVVRSLFDKYQAEQSPKFDSDSFFALNRCKNSCDIAPPQNLARNTKKIDLDRIAKIQRVFGQIPVFSNDDKYTIREFLTTMNTTAEHLGGEVGAKLNEAEYGLILNSKLSPRVKTTISQYKSDNLAGLYSNLINLFDESEDKRTAFSQIVNGGKKFANLKGFTEEMLRLLSLSQKNNDAQSELFVHALENILPKRIFEKITDYSDNYTHMTGGKAPPFLV